MDTISNVNAGPSSTPWSAPGAPALAPASNASTALKADVIDLTASDDDSDEASFYDHDGLPSDQDPPGVLEDPENDDDNSSDIGVNKNGGPLTAEQTLALQSAIATSPITRLRDICTRLVQNNDEVARAMAHVLLGMSRDTGEVQQRWAICVHCGEEYSPREQSDVGDCVYHDGILEVNEEEFADWDEDCHGPMDSAETREEYPQNFTWSCCEADGTSEGCERRAHESSRKRRRTNGT